MIGPPRCRAQVAADVHEEDVRLVEEEVVVQRRYLEPFVERRAHGRVDFVLEQEPAVIERSPFTNRSANTSP
jgi:hypothetical protein